MLGPILYTDSDGFAAALRWLYCNDPNLRRGKIRVYSRAQIPLTAAAASCLLALLFRRGSLCFTPELDQEPEESLLAVGAGAAAAWLRQRGGALAAVVGGEAAGGGASGGRGAHADSEAAVAVRTPADKTQFV